LAFSSRPRELSENQNSTPDWNSHEAKITTSRVGIAEIIENWNTSWTCIRPDPPTVSAARRSASRRPSRTRIAIAGSSMPISSVAVSSEGSNWPFSAWPERVRQATADMTRKAATATISMVAKMLARRAPICTRRHQRGQRRLSCAASAIIVACLQHLCCRAAREMRRQAPSAAQDRRS
jgi:hypothetical protein